MIYMFDLYGLNGEKKLSNITQCGRVEATLSIDEQIINSNLIGSLLVVVSVLYVDRYFITLTSIGITSTVRFGDNNFTIYFDRAKGTLSVSTDVVDKTKVVIKGYSYIK